MKTIIIAATLAVAMLATTSATAQEPTETHRVAVTNDSLTMTAASDLPPRVVADSLTVTADQVNCGVMLAACGGGVAVAPPDSLGGELAQRNAESIAKLEVYSIIHSVLFILLAFFVPVSRRRD